MSAVPEAGPPITRLTSDAFARLQAARPRQIMWFLGAGASMAAGVPTAEQLTWRFKRLLYATETATPMGTIDIQDPTVRRRIQRYLDRQGTLPRAGAPDEYAALFEAAYPFPADRRRFLDQLVTAARPTYGQLALAVLLQQHLVPVVWTTNFDRTIEDAVIELAGTTTALMTANLAEPSVAMRSVRESRFPLLVKLHGDYQSDYLKNTSAELQHQDAELRRTLRVACLRFGVVIAGYSGRDSSVMQALTSAIEQTDAFPAGLYWVHRSTEPPEGPAAELLAEASARGIQTAWVRALSFDELLRAVLVPVDVTAEAKAKLEATSPPPKQPAARQPQRQLLPSLRYARTEDGIRIAYTVTGHGPPFIWMPSTPFSYVVGQWRVPRLRSAYERLGQSVRLLIYDGRGTGSSERDVDDVGLDAMVRDLDAVADAARVEKFALFGYYSTVPAAIAYAARHPERVTKLVLLGGYALFGDDVASLRRARALMTLIDQDWDLFLESIAHTWVGWPAGEDGRLLVEGLRESTTPEMARIIFEATNRNDITALAGDVRVPALVLHREAYTEIPLEISQRLAEALPDGRLVLLEGSTAGSFFEDPDNDAAVVLDFLIGDPQAR